MVTVVVSVRWLCGCSIVVSGVFLVKILRVRNVSLVGLLIMLIVLLSVVWRVVMYGLVLSMR